MEWNVTTVSGILGSIGTLYALIKELMGIAQEAFPPGSGQEKKAAVLDGVKALVDNQTVWDRVKNVISLIIDFLAMFKKKETPMT